MSEKIYDLLGVGIGPFNLSLACLTDAIDGMDAVYLDQKPTFNWHPGMMLESAHLQTPFMADLVTLADPTSRFSVLNYLKQKGKLYSFYIREDFFLLRKEYNQYCQWACDQLASLQWNTRVERVTRDEQRDCYCVDAINTVSGERQQWLARHLVLGTGPTPWMPDWIDTSLEQVVHSGHYLAKKQTLQQQSAITVVGSGQSAAEIFYDLLQDIDQYRYQLNWVTRAPRFFPLEYTRLTLEMTSPEWVDYFHALPEAQRDRLNASQKNLYKGINESLINDIYELLYRKDLEGPLPVTLCTDSGLVAMEKNENQRLTLTLSHQVLQEEFSLTTDGVIMSTGYTYRPPEFLTPLMPLIEFDRQQRYAVGRDYSIDRHHSLFVQNAELHTHGFVSPDLGMACYRNSVILRSILGREVYPVEKKIAFQTFGLPKEAVDG